jgi:transcriptional regulator with XRE-family HTH domain
VVAGRNPFLRKLGERIRDLRQKAKMSQEVLADEAGLDRSYMSGIERGVRNVSVLNLARVAKALGIPITRLFSDSE